MMWIVAAAGAAFVVSVLSANAALNPSLHKTAQSAKSKQYLTEGYFTGGDKSVTSAKLKDIRRAKSPDGYERIVFDLIPQVDGAGAAPYYQVQAAPNEHRVVVSIWADVGYDFDAKRIRKAFAKSVHVKKINIVPRVEDGLSVIEFVVEKKIQLEAFHLGNPTRIIVDMI